MKMATVGQKKKITELFCKAAWTRKFEESPQVSPRVSLGYSHVNSTGQL